MNFRQFGKKKKNSKKKNEVRSYKEGEKPHTDLAERSSGLANRARLARGAAGNVGVGVERAGLTAVCAARAEGACRAHGTAVVWKRALGTAATGRFDYSFSEKEKAGGGGGGIEEKEQEEKKRRKKSKTSQLKYLGQARQVRLAGVSAKVPTGQSLHSISLAPEAGSQTDFSFSKNNTNFPRQSAEVPYMHHLLAYFIFLK